MTANDGSQIGHAEAFDHDTATTFTYEKPTSSDINKWLDKYEEFVAVTIGLRDILMIKSTITKRITTS